MILAFGRYELDEERFERRCDRRAVALQPKALTLLLYLVRNCGRAISKEELLGAVWPDTVVTAGSLARAVSLARTAIGDRGREPAAISTVPRRGYRFHLPVRAVTQRTANPGPTRAERDPASNYVGRAELVARLSAVFDAALAGAGRILFLAGEAGIGKTRTAELLAERARAAGAVATAWGLEDSAAPTYWAWTRIFRALARAAGQALPEILAGDATELGPAGAEFGVDEVASASRKPLASARGDGESARYRLFEAAQAFLARAARRRPLALFFDDLHWADGRSHSRNLGGPSRRLVVRNSPRGTILKRDGHPIDDASPLISTSNAPPLRSTSRNRRSLSELDLYCVRLLALRPTLPCSGFP